MQEDMTYERLRRSPQPRPSRPHGEGSFPGKEVALELLSLIWKDEEAEGVGSGTSFLAQGSECATARRHEATVQPVGWAGDAG